MHACSLDAFPIWSKLVMCIIGRLCARSRLFACLPMTCPCVAFALPCCPPGSPSPRPLGKLPARWPTQMPPAVAVAWAEAGRRGYAIATLFHTANQPRPRPHSVCLLAIVLTHSLTHSLTSILPPRATLTASVVFDSIFLLRCCVASFALPRPSLPASLSHHAPPGSTSHM